MITHSHKKTSKRLAPFSLRMTLEERGYLEAQAGSSSLGTYIRSVLFHKHPHQPCVRDNRTAPRRKQRHRARMPEENVRLLSQILAKLGKTQSYDNLSSLSHAAKSGALYVSPEIEAALLNACNDTAAIKTMLMQALGIRED